MKRSYKICFLGYEELSDIAQQVLQRHLFDDLNVLLLDSTPDTLSEKVEYAIQQGCEAFIAGSSNAAEFRKISDMPLTEIYIQTIDYALALKKAFYLGNLPALFTYRFSRKPNLDLIRTLIDREFLHIVYEDTYDLLMKLNETKADVIVGASMVNSLAQNHQKKSVLLYPGSSTVEDAFRRCQSSMNNLYLRNRNQVIYRSIINNDVNGIICINENDELILYNPAAEKITGISSRQAQHCRSRDLFPWAELDTMLYNDVWHADKSLVINDQMVDIMSFKIEVNNNIVGALMLLSPQNVSQSPSSPPPLRLPPVNLRKNFDQIICSSEAMSRTVSNAKLYSVQNEPCMIIGEVGTGKAYLANAMHLYAHSGQKPLYRVNCSTIPAKQAAQYFFGRENASGEVISYGILELSDQSTLVIEHICDADPVTQNCLAQTIKTGYIQRINGKEFIPVNVRILTTVLTSEWESLHTKLSSELFYFLTPLSLCLPPLRKRIEDIPAFFETFVNDRLSLRTNTFVSAKTLLPVFREYSWPGNLRELENVAFRFALFLDKRGKLTPAAQRRALISSIGEDNLFQDIMQNFGNLCEIKNSPEQLVKLAEKLKFVLSYNNEQIAKKLDISRTTLWRLLNRNQQKL